MHDTPSHLMSLPCHLVLTPLPSPSPPQMRSELARNDARSWIIIPTSSEVDMVGPLEGDPLLHQGETPGQEDWEMADRVQVRDPVHTED